MNERQYTELKEMVIGMNDVKIYNLFEILVDEINYRKIKVNPNEIRSF